MLAELLRALPVAILVGMVPGYFWARCLSPSRDRIALLAYSTALSMALVPTAATLQARLFDTGVTVLVAAISAAGVFAAGLAVYLRFGPMREDGESGLARPPTSLSTYALLPLVVVFGLLLGAYAGYWTGARHLITVVVLVLISGVMAQFPSRSSIRGGPAGELRPLVRGALISATLGLVLVRGYLGPVRHDWPFIRGGDQYSHAVMSGLMMTEGRIDSYLIYPPGFHTMTAIVSRLSGLQPLEIFPVLAPALLVLPVLGCYALATRLWSQPHGVAAALFCGLLLVGPYESFAEARYPNLLSADFLLIMAVAALVGVYASPALRPGLLLALLGSSVVLYHQVGSLYLAALLALVAVLFLPYLLLTGRRKQAAALFLSLAFLGLLSVAYAWDTYDLPRLVAGLLGGSDTGAGGTAVAIAIGSQEPLSLDHLLATTSQPVAWLGLLGILLAAGEILRGHAGTSQTLAYLTLILWTLITFAGSRTSLSGFPQRFERDLGIPLAVLAALAFVAILRSVRWNVLRMSPAAQLVAVLAATLAVVAVGFQSAQNMAAAGKGSTNVISRDVAQAGEWLGDHDAGGNIVVTPYLNDHVPGSAMLAMGGYTGLRSYTQERLRTPRALPPSGKEPLLAANWMMQHPTGERTESLLKRYDIGYVVLFKRYPGVPWRAFDRAPDAYEEVFENDAVAIFAPTRAEVRRPARDSGPTPKPGASRAPR